MPQSRRAHDPDPETREIRLLENPYGQWTVRDLRAEISAQGKTREDALSALDRGVAVLRGDEGHEPTDEELRELGVDPDVARSGFDLPDVLQ